MVVCVMHLLKWRDIRDICSDLGCNFIASKQSYRQPQETDDGSLNDERVFRCIDEQTVQVVLYAPPEYCHPIPADDNKRITFVDLSTQQHCTDICK